MYIFRNIGRQTKDYVLDGLNATDKRFLKILMTTVQNTGASTKDSQMFMHTSMSNT